MHKLSGGHDDRYYKKVELDNKVNAHYHSKSAYYPDQYVEAETWSYFGADGIILNPGKWLINYSAHISNNAQNAGKPFSIRSTVNIDRGCTVIIGETYTCRASFSEIISTNGINNLKLQVYSPVVTRYAYISMTIQAIKLND